MWDAKTFHLQGLCQGSLILRTTLVYNLFIYYMVIMAPILSYYVIYQLSNMYLLNMFVS